MDKKTPTKRVRGKRRKGGKETAEATAELIVRAVNALVAACERALKIETAATITGEQRLREGYREMLRAALDLAKGGAE